MSPWVVGLGAFFSPPWNHLGEKKYFSNNAGLTSQAPLQIATPWTPINRWEADSILMESPTWQLNNNHKLLVAGFCLHQERKKKSSQRPLSLLFIKKLDKYSSVSVWSLSEFEPAF